MANVMWGTGSAHYWLIADTAKENVANALSAAREKGLAVYYGAALPELAAAIHVDPAKLEATVARYNELCAAGADADFGKAANNLAAYEGTAGYYAHEMWGATYGTMGGGIKTDRTGHVLTESGSVIANLYAAGECADGNIFGDCYAGGMSMGTFTTIGRVVGETAAKELGR